MGTAGVHFPILFPLWGGPWSPWATCWRKPRKRYPKWGKLGPQSEHIFNDIFTFCGKWFNAFGLHRHERIGVRATRFRSLFGSRGKWFVLPWDYIWAPLHYIWAPMVSIFLSCSHFGAGLWSPWATFWRKPRKRYPKWGKWGPKVNTFSMIFSLFAESDSMRLDCTGMSGLGFGPLFFDLWICLSGP